MVLRGSPMTLGKLPGIFFTFVFRPGPMLVKKKASNFGAQFCLIAI